MSHPFNIGRNAVPQVTCNGSAMALGESVTSSSDVHAVTIDNGIIQLTTETTTPDDGQRGACHLYRSVNNTPTRAVEAAYGDYTYFNSSISSHPTRVKVTKKDGGAAEIVMQWDGYSLGVGAPLFDQAYSYGYIESTGTIKRITSCTLSKVVRVNAGEEGYYVGYHTSPYTGPWTKDLPGVLTHDNSWGERELGDGGGDAVCFSSAGFTSRHPGWGQTAGWTAGVVTAVGNNRVAWCGIDDPTYAPWNDADVMATQHAGFPNTQNTGPWWVAGIHETYPFCRFVVLPERQEIGIWQQAADQRGKIVNHFTLPLQDLAGSLRRFQFFLGATPYTADSSSSFANEPTTALRTLIADKATSIYNGWPT